MKTRHIFPARASRFERPVLLALAAAVIAGLTAGGCATEVNTFEPGPGDETAGTASSGGSGGKASQGGSKATAGSATAASGSGPSAFGGTTATAGSGGKGGTASQAGAAGNGGTGSTAGSANGGAGGAQAGRSNGGGGAGGSAAGMAGAGGGVATGCLKDWRDNTSCDTCTTQTQGDKLACADILDCFAVNDCGPSTCADNDQKCGVNKISKGTAGYPVAAEVHACICE